VKIVQPNWIFVELKVNIREGISTIVKRYWGMKEGDSVEKTINEKNGVFDMTIIWYNWPFAHDSSVATAPSSYRERITDAYPLGLSPSPFGTFAYWRMLDTPRTLFIYVVYRHMMQIYYAITGIAQSAVVTIFRYF